MPENGMVNISRLREATAPDHAAAEAAMPLLKPGLTKQTYVEALEGIFGVVAPWEGLLSTLQEQELLDLVRPRMRLSQLVADLEGLGSRPEKLPCAPMPALSSLAQMLGAMYVMEGSRLGGQLLARHIVAQPGLEGTRSTSYFCGFGPQTGERWREFLAYLGAHVPEDQTDEVIRGAKSMFRVFETWMGRSQLAGQNFAVSPMAVGE